MDEPARPEPPPPRPKPPTPPTQDWDQPEPKRDLFIPILVGISFGGYALIILYDVFFGNGLCGVTITCSQSPWE